MRGKLSTCNLGFFASWLLWLERRGSNILLLSLLLLLLAVGYIRWAVFIFFLRHHANTHACMACMTCMGIFIEAFCRLKKGTALTWRASLSLASRPLRTHLPHSSLVDRWIPNKGRLAHTLCTWCEWNQPVACSAPRFTDWQINNSIFFGCMCWGCEKPMTFH